MADYKVLLKDGEDVLYPQSTKWISGSSWSSLDISRHEKNALNRLSDLIPTLENEKTHTIGNLPSETGPVFGAIVYKYTNDYYSGLLLTYAVSEECFLHFQKQASTYRVRLI